MKSPEYLLVVNHASKYGLDGINDVRKNPAFADLRILVLTNRPQKFTFLANESYPSEVIECNFESDEEIIEALRPYKDHIRAATCRGDEHIQYFQKVIPHLPLNVLTPTTDALDAATNKRLMREAFLRHHPEITPQFVHVHDDSRATIEAVEAKLEYPVIVKPANLASSLLIQACHSRSELETALRNVFAVIDDTYKRHGRSHAPQVIVEEYLEGDFYSVDAYALGRGDYYYCPIVGYIPAKQIGIDDFFLYKRSVPTKLTEDQTAAANEAVAKAMAATGLTYSSAHVELVLTKNGWKIIELGPRLGRFRHRMYEQAYGINHSCNDLLIRLNQQPQIPHKLLQHCAAYSIYPDKEGSLKEIRGLAKLEGNPAIKFLRVFAQPGDKCTHAKNGGGALAEFVIADADLQAYKELVGFIEDHVEAVVE